MMVLFIYVSTLAGNEKLVFPSTFLGLILPLFVLTPLLPLESTNLIISHLYSDLSVSLLLFLTFYLLRTLIIVVFLAQGFKGALMSYT